MGERVEESGVGLRDATLVSRNPQIVGRELGDGGGTLLLHRTTGAYHRLNRTGGLVWLVLGEPIRFDELVRRVGSELVEAPALLTEDLAVYVTDLAARDLVHLDRPPIPS